MTVASLPLSGRSAILSGFSWSSERQADQGDYEYVTKLAKAGFDAIEVEATRVYGVDDARAFLAGEGHDVDALAQQIDGAIVSAFIRATKPVATACCGSSCCA